MKTKQELLTLSPYQIILFGNKLSTLNYLKFNEKDIEKIKDFVCSDGCTGVPNWYVEACIIHDFYYRTHKDFDGTPISKEEADKRLRKKIQKLSFAKWFSPMSWWRWAAVRLFANKAWEE